MKLASFLISLLIHFILIGLLFLLFKSVATHTVPTYTVSLLVPGEGRAGFQKIQPITQSKKSIPKPATTLPPKINQAVKKTQEQVPLSTKNNEKSVKKPQNKIKEAVNNKSLEKQKIKTKPQPQVNINKKVRQLQERAVQEKITQLKEALLENKIREIAQQLKENSQTQSGIGNIKATGTGIGNQDELFSDYLSVVQGIIHSNWFVDQSLLPNNKLVTKVKIVISENGKIISSTVVKSSGNLYYDRSVISAINSSTLPTVPKRYLNNHNALDLILNFFIKG